MFGRSFFLVDLDVITSFPHGKSMLPQRTHGFGHVARLFQPFGVDLSARLAPHNGNPEAMAVAFDQAKVDAKKRFKEMALALHPDRGGDEEQLKEVISLWNILKGLEVKARPKPKRVSFTVVSVQVFTDAGTGSMPVDNLTSALRQAGRQEVRRQEVGAFFRDSPWSDE